MKPPNLRRILEDITIIALGILIFIWITTTPACSEIIYGS